jgi:hypothetical protein
MRVSVILPVRNGGAYLPLAVGSVLTQSAGDFELLVIDDHSQDGAVEALEASDARLRRLVNPGRGLVDALNFGLAEARGEFIARMDADDIALPDRLARQIAFLDRRPEIAVVGAQVAFIDATGQPTGERTHFPTDPAAVAAALMTRGCVLKHPSVLARREVMRGAGGYRAAVAKAEDYDLWLRLSEHHRLANLPETLLNYRVHANQISTGVNLGQRFAHDLALIAARRRRRGEPDPIEGIGEALSFDDPSPGGASASPIVARLASAYRALSFFEGGVDEAPDAGALDNLIEAARQGLLGDGRRYRTQALARCAHLALRRGQWRQAAAAATLALGAAPGRALPVLIGAAR